MGLKKFRKVRAEDEGYFNLSVVCHNYDMVTKNKTKYIYNMYPKGDDRSILLPVKFDHN